MFEQVEDLGILYPSLFARYVQKDPEVLSCFAVPYQEMGVYRQLAARLAESPPWQLPKKLVAKQNEGILKNQSRLSRLLKKKILDENTLFVITGQQPGLLTGPVYGIYKAMTAVKLAARLEEQLQRPVQPLFWIAGEDHNVFDLVRLFLLDSQGKLARVRLNFPGFGPPVGEICLDQDDMLAVLKRLEELTPQSPYKNEVLQSLREITIHSSTMTDWFAGLMQLLFHQHKLALLDPLDLSKNGAYIPLLLKTVELGPQIHQCLDSAEKRMAQKGFSPQVDRTGQESFLMIVWEGRRYALYRDGDTFFTAKGELSLTRYELISMFQSEPWRFSPNVLLRPLFQDSLFPNLAYIPGPGELAYFTQLQEVYRLFGLEMPVLFPRLGVTLLEAWQKELQQKHGFSFADALTYASSACEDPAKKEGEPVEKEMIRHYVWPRCRPQERVFNLFPFLLRHGWPFWEDFSRNFPEQEGHYLYSLGSER